MIGYLFHIPVNDNEIKSGGRHPCLPPVWNLLSLRGLNYEQHWKKMIACNAIVNNQITSNVFIQAVKIILEILGIYMPLFQQLFVDDTYLMTTLYVFGTPVYFLLAAH